MNPQPLHRNTRRVAAAAAGLGLTIQVRRFPDGTGTAADAAAAIGCDLGAIVKSLVLASDAGPLLVLTSGRNRVDYDKVAAAVGAEGIRRADADAARAATGFPIGGTPPFGHPVRLATLCDVDLLGYPQTWAAAGTPDTVFALAPDQLLAATGAQVADVAQRPPR
ncbi:MAG: YbaK/EbsC family protein [Actinomycetota bacterium]|nr:YbaK/EbsC family protein [Actinomycetota bacterium]